MFDRKKEHSDFTWMHSEQPDAFVSDGRNDDNFLEFFDSVLLNGFNERQTISVDIVDNLTIKLTYEFPHGYEPRQNINIEGSDIPKINGKHKIYEVDVYTLLIKVRDIVGNTNKIITTKIAPLGFENVLNTETTLSGKRAYRSKNTNSSRMVLFMDGKTKPYTTHPSSPLRSVKIDVYRDITDDGLPLGGNLDTRIRFWHQIKSMYWDATTPKSRRNWVIFGNGDYFYLLNSWSTYSTDNNIYNRDFYSFGDIDYIDINTRCIITSGMAISTSTQNPAPSNMVANFVGSNQNASKGYYNIITESTVNEFSHSPYGGNSGYTSGAGGGISFPNPSTNTIILTPVYISSGGCVHGRYMRLYGIPQSLGGLDTVTIDKKIKDDVLLICVNINRWLAFDVGYDYG